MYEEALRDYLEVGDPGSAGGAALGLGQLALIRGQFPAAHAWADEADRLYGSVERRGHMNTALVRGDALLAMGDVTGARAIYAAVLQETHERGMSLTRAQALDRCGWAHAREEQWEQAILHCAAAQQLLDDAGAAWSQAERDRRSEWLEKSRQSLGQAQFEDLWRHGQEQSEELLVRCSGHSQRLPVTPWPNSVDSSWC